MTPEKVVELLKQLGIKLDTSAELPAFWVSLEELQRFAQLVRNEAIEDCAHVCDYENTAMHDKLAEAIKVLREALRHMITVCPAIDSNGEEAHEHAFNAMSDTEEFQ